MQFRVGVLVLATAIIGVVLVILFRDRPAFLRGSYPVTVELPTARGVAEGTPVRRRGVLIGSVTKVELTDDYVRVLLSIDSAYKLSSEETATYTTSLLGDAEIEFVRPNRPTSSGGARPPAIAPATSTSGS